MEQNRLRIIIITSFVLLSLAIVGIIALFTNSSSQQTNNPNQTERIDPGSGEEVVNTEGKTPEKYGVNPNEPSFLGLVGLVDRGMTLSDVDDVKAFWNDYANQQLVEGKEKINEISITVDSIEHVIDSAAHTETFRMPLTINRERQYTFSAVSNSDTAKKTYTLAQDEGVVYSKEQDL